MTASRQPLLLTEAQVAFGLRCEVTALRAMRAAGVGPAYRVLPDGRVLYAPAAVRGWLNGDRGHGRRPGR